MPDYEQIPTISRFATSRQSCFAISTLFVVNMNADASKMGPFETSILQAEDSRGK
jgi:hypothetical protein